MEKRNVDKLNSFLRGEISAVETYLQALDRVGTEPFADTLRHNLRSHEKRAELLRERVRTEGGVPSEGSGMWGAFAKLVEGGAKLFGTDAAIAALEEGEDHGRDDYRRDLDELDPSTRDFITLEILPEQEATHRAMSDLKHRRRAA